MIDELDAASPNRRESSLIQLTKFNKEIHKSLHRLRGTFPQIFKNSRPWWSSKQVINFPSIGQKSTIKCRIFSQAAPSFQPRILRSRRAQLPAEISLTEDRCFIPVGNNARYHVPGCFSFNSWGAAVTFLVVRRIPYHRHNREVQICVLKTMTTQSIPTPWKIIMAQFHIFFEVLFGFVCLIGRRDFWKTSIPAREGVDFMEGRGRFEWSLGFGQTASVEIVVYLESALNLRIVSCQRSGRRHALKLQWLTIEGMLGLQVFSHDFSAYCAPEFATCELAKDLSQLMNLSLMSACVCFSTKWSFALLVSALNSKWWLVSLIEIHRELDKIVVESMMVCLWFVMGRGRGQCCGCTRSMPNQEYSIPRRLLLVPISIERMSDAR